MGKLVLHLPDGSTRDIVLSRERMTIGRRADNDICLPLPTVSAEHAAVVTVLDDSFLEDLGSRNGTLVNGKEIKKHFLRDHDEIDIGRQRLIYVSGTFEAEVPAGKGQPAPEASGPRFVGSRRPEREENPPAMIDTAELFAPPEEPSVHAPKRGEGPTLEVLDGPNAGIVASIDGDEFVLGRLGVQVAAIRRTPDGFRLTLVEGDLAPTINGATLPGEGALLALGDEIVLAGTRLRYRPGP